MKKQFPNINHFSNPYDYWDAIEEFDNYEEEDFESDSF